MVRVPFSTSVSTMLVLAGIVVLHITTIILLLVTTIDNVSKWTGKCESKLHQPDGETGISDVMKTFLATLMNIFRLPTSL